MQQICKQIRESKPKGNPRPNKHGYGAHSEKPNHPALVQPLDLTDLVAPENLKAGNNIIIKSCAKRECRCEFATARKPPLKPRHVEKQNKLHGFMPLPDLQEQQEEEELANDENDGNHTASSHRWNSDSFSFAKYCEAKLEDLFKSDGNTCNESPDARRTEACFQVLEELCQNKLPFSSVLRHICDELRRATYHISQDSSNGACGTEERAYFEMARELEGEIAQMEAENSAWQSRLSAQTHDLMITRGELEELGDELTETDIASHELEEKLSLTVQALSFEKNKVNGLHEKIKKLKKELKEIRHEVKHSQQIESLKDKELDEYEKLKALYMQLVHEFQHAQAFLHSSQCEVAESASKKDLIAAKAEILELEDKISQVRAQVDAFVYETRALTPRPQWGRQVPGMDKPPALSTAQQIEKICRENAFLVASASRLQIDFAATEATLAEIQGIEKNKTKSEKKTNPISNANPKKGKGKSKFKEKAEK